MRKYQATKLKKLTMTKLVMFNKTEIKPCGEVMIKVVNPQNKKKCKVRFVITMEACSPVLGLRAVQGRELITVNTENIATVSQEKENDVLENYKAVFAGEIGKLEGKLHLETNKEFTPVNTPCRKWPLTVQQKVKDELDRLEIQSCIRRLREVVDWPRMSSDLESFIKECQNQQKELLISSEIPGLPWQHVRADLFELEEKSYLVSVDHYSDFLEVDVSTLKITMRSSRK